MSRITVLIVDDEAPARRELERLLRGIEGVEIAGSVGVAGEAVGAARRTCCHLVLLDIHMPGMDGMQVLKAIKEKHPGVKVIMVTALETREKIEEAMRLGADNYITKPLSLEYLEKDVQEKIEHLTED